jgi:hypothetical protein
MMTKSRSHATGTRARFLTLPLTLGCMAMSVSSIGDELLRFVFITGAGFNSLGINVGAVGLLLTVPVLWSGWIGARIDRHRSRSGAFLVGVNLIAGAMTFALWSLWHTELFTATVYLLCVALGFFSTAALVLWRTMVPELVGAEDPESIKKVMSWSLVMIAIGGACGPLAAAGFSAVLDRRDLILLDACSFLIAAAALAPTVRRTRLAAPRGPAGARSKPRWHEGAALVLAHPLTRWPTIALGLMNFLTVGVYFCIPLVVLEQGGDETVVAGAVFLFVLGSLIGSSIGAVFRQDFMFRLYLIAEPVVRAAGLVLIVAFPDTVGLYAGLVLFTVGQGTGRVARAANLAVVFDAERRARAFGGYQMLIQGAMPVAPLAMTGVVDAAGTTAFLVGAIAMFLALGGLIAVNRRSRRASETSQEAAHERRSVS